MREWETLTFADEIQNTAEKAKSRTVLALDIENPDPKQLLNSCIRVLDEVKEQICALKINHQLLLTLGIRTISDLVARAHQSSLPTIMDAKLNDVAHTNAFMMRSFLKAGFDAVIASPVPGWEGGLDSIFSLAREHDKGIILLVYMSNPGAERLYETSMGNQSVYENFAQLGLEWKAQGIVVGGTRPEIIRRVRAAVGPKMAIYSPGIGAQGGEAKKAVEAGATYLIVGRAIYASSTPSSAADEINRATR